MVWESLMRTLLKALFTLEEHLLFLECWLILSTGEIHQLSRSLYEQNICFVCLGSPEKCKNYFREAFFCVE